MIVRLDQSTKCAKWEMLYEFQKYTLKQKLTLLHLFTDLFRKEILPHSSEYLQG